MQGTPPIRLGFFKRMILDINLRALRTMTHDQFVVEEFLDGAKMAFSVSYRARRHMRFAHRRSLLVGWRG